MLYMRRYCFLLLIAMASTSTREASAMAGLEQGVSTAANVVQKVINLFSFDDVAPAQSSNRISQSKQLDPLSAKTRSKLESGKAKVNNVLQSITAKSKKTQQLTDAATKEAGQGYGALKGQANKIGNKLVDIKVTASGGKSLPPKNVVKPKPITQKQLPQKIQLQTPRYQQPRTPAFQSQTVRPRTTWPQTGRR